MCIKYAYITIVGLCGYIQKPAPCRYWFHARVCFPARLRSCLAPFLLKAPASNESRQVFGRVTIKLFLTADRFKMDPSQKCATAAAAASAAACVEVKIYCMYIHIHLDRNCVYVGNLVETLRGKRRESERKWKRMWVKKKKIMKREQDTGKKVLLAVHRKSVPEKFDATMAASGYVPT